MSVTAAEQASKPDRRIVNQTVGPKQKRIALARLEPNETNTNWRFENIHDAEFYRYASPERFAGLTTEAEIFQARVQAHNSGFNLAKAIARRLRTIGNPNVTDNAINRFYGEALRINPYLSGETPSEVASLIERKAPFPTAGNNAGPASPEQLRRSQPHSEPIAGALDAIPQADEPAAAEPPVLSETGKLAQDSIKRAANLLRLSLHDLETPGLSPSALLGIVDALVIAEEHLTSAARARKAIEPAGPELEIDGAPVSITHSGLLPAAVVFNTNAKTDEPEPENLEPTVTPDPKPKPVIALNEEPEAVKPVLEAAVVEASEPADSLIDDPELLDIGDNTLWAAGSDQLGEPLDLDLRPEPKATPEREPKPPAEPKQKQAKEPKKPIVWKTPVRIKNDHEFPAPLPERPASADTARRNPPQQMGRLPAARVTNKNTQDLKGQQRRYLTETENMHQTQHLLKPNVDIAQIIARNKAAIAARENARRRKP